jgi:hypothetical protein
VETKGKCGELFQDGFKLGRLIFSFVFWRMQAFDNERFVPKLGNFHF